MKRKHYTYKNPLLLQIVDNDLKYIFHQNIFNKSYLLIKATFMFEKFIRKFYVYQEDDLLNSLTTIQKQIIDMPGKNQDFKDECNGLLQKCKTYINNNGVHEIADVSNFFIIIKKFYLFLI